MSPHHVSRRRRVRGFTLIELVVCICVVGILIALLLPATRRTREPARRTQCKNNLKQIGLALHNYHDTWGAFPPAYTVDADGKPLHSWRTLILPYLDHATLYKSLDLSKPWDDSANAALLTAQVATYRCPSSPADVSGTSYLAIVTDGSVFGVPKSCSVAEITDGTSSTLLVIEVPYEQAVPWYAPQDAGETVLRSLEPTAPRQHSGGQHGLMADGAVRFVSLNLDAQTFQALITATGGNRRRYGRRLLMPS